MTSTQTTAPSPLPATPTLIQRVGSVFMRLAQLVADRLAKDRSEANLARVMMAQDRLLGFSRRLRNLLTRIEAGRLGEPRPRKAPTAAREKTARKPGPPRRRGWIREHAGPDYHQVNWGIGQVENLLTEPGTLEALRKAPRQAGRIVRPMCHMLALDVPTDFRLPPRPRPARVPKPREPAWRMPWGTPRVASAQWPKGCVAPGETVPLRSRNRRRQRRNE